MMAYSFNTPDMAGTFAKIGELGNTFDRGRIAGARRAISGLGPGNADQIAQFLFAHGDVEGGMQVAKLAETQALRSDTRSRDERDFGFRQQEAQRAQSNANRSFGLQQQQFGLAQRTADEAARGFDIREVDDGEGGKILVRVQKATGRAERLPIGGMAPDAGGNPYAPGGKPTEGQANAALYANRMFEAESILRDPKIVAAATSIEQRARAAPPVPFIGAGGRSAVGNLMTDESYQKFDQAQRNFINAVLRRESGAVISPEEFSNASIQYFPRPGDTEEVLKQKQSNRAEAIRGIAGASGRGYQPPQLFDQQGNLVPNPNARNRAAAPPAPPPPAGGPVRVNSPAEAARLPKGTRFIDPNGVERIVP